MLVTNSVPRSPRRWAVLAVLCLALLVVGLDVTILNVALPTIAGAMDASTSELQWIVDAYLLAFAGAMLPAGFAGDRLGHKRVLLGGLFVFAVASAWSALAGSIGELIAARALMGVGAATVMPLAIAIVPATFGGAERTRAIAIITAAIGVGLPLGPIVGGALLEHFAWGAVFWVNVPLIAVALAAGTLFLRESRNQLAPRLDLVGALLAAMGIVAVVFALVHAPEHGWGSTWTLIPGLVGLSLLGGLVLWERHAAHPLVDPRLFADRRFAWGTVVSVLVTFALYGLLFVIPQFLQTVVGHDALGTGLRLVPLMGGLIVAAPLSSLADRLAGTGRTVAAGLVVFAAGLVALSQVTTGWSDGSISTALAVCGIGVGGAMAPAMDAVIGALPDGHTGAGAAVNNTLRQFGGAVGVALLGSVLSATYAARAAEGQAAGLAFTAGMSSVLLICAAVVATGALFAWRCLPSDATASMQP